MVYSVDLREKAVSMVEKRKGKNRSSRAIRNRNSYAV